MSYDGRVHVWVKQEDRAKWDSIKNKPEWLHVTINLTASIESAKEDIAAKLVKQLPPVDSVMEKFGLKRVVEGNDLVTTDPDTTPESRRAALYPELKKDVFND